MSNRKRQKNERARGGHEGDIWKGLAAGVVGGLIASAVMNQFQALLSKLVEGKERSHGAQSLQQGSPQRGLGRELAAQGKDDADDDAPERLANAISVGLFDHELTKPEKERAGVAFHYVMGASSGVIYGAAAEFAPVVTAGAGLPFGAAVWLVADEGVVPAAGLSKSPSEYPLSVHAYAFASHLVYGLTTELVRRAVRSAL
jgi:putative membrane protein